MNSALRATVIGTIAVAALAVSTPQAWAQG